MVSKFRTIDFLPEIFKTDTNRQFLNATLDVLSKQPNLGRTAGYIGERYGYSINPNDPYVVEPDKTRADYQLEPSVVFLKENTQTAKDFISYPGLLEALKNDGANTNNHDRLWKEEIYNWDPFVDIDKVLNYRHYYWIPFGPLAVPITTATAAAVIYDTGTFTIDQKINGFTIINVIGENPTLTLIRGGTYSFIVGPEDRFYIQGVPGLTGYDSANNIDTRDVLGVTNNGNLLPIPTPSGLVTFTVPYKDAQDQYNVGGSLTVDLVTTKQFSEVNGQAISEIDGISGNLNGRTLLFYDNGDISSQQNFYTITQASPGGIVTLTIASSIPVDTKIQATDGTTYINRNFFYSTLAGEMTIIPYLSSQLDQLYYQSGIDPNSVGVIKLIDANTENFIDVENDILGKTQYTSPNGVTLTNGLKVRLDFTALQSEYRYQDFYVEGVGNSIQLLPVSKFIVTEVNRELIYRPWDLEGWDTEYWDLDSFAVLTPQYITIKRNSRDYNAWSRSNRWFSQEVIDTVTRFFGSPSNPKYNPATRALRPIIEYQENLNLINSGTSSAGSVTVFTTDSTDALVDIVGLPIGSPAETYPSVEGVVLAVGNKIVFANDINPDVKNKIWIVDYVVPGSDPNYITLSTNSLSLTTGSKTLNVAIGLGYVPTDEIMITYDGSNYMIGTVTTYNSATGVMVVNITGVLGSGTYSNWTVNLTSSTQKYINLVEDKENPIHDQTQVHIKYGVNNLGKTWRYNAATQSWIECQQKTLTNQYPLFDIFNENDISFSDVNYYPDSDFNGCVLFSYTPGDGANDPILGFPITTTTITSLGDINFTVNLNTDTFTYEENGSTVVKNVKSGYVHYMTSPTSWDKKIGWIPAIDESYQRQVFEFTTTQSADTLICDVPVKTTTEWSPVIIYLEDDILKPTNYTYAVNTTNSTTVITLNETIPAGSKLSVLLISDTVSKTAYYEIPTNLKNNPFNEDITTLDVGDLRSQFESIYNNIPGAKGDIAGSNNLKDLGNINRYGNTIIKNSASVAAAGPFLRKADLNIQNALQFNSEQYINYKYLLIDIVEKTDFTIDQVPADMLDYVVEQIKDTKSLSTTFFWTDMLFSGSPYLTNTYNLNVKTNNLIINLSKVYNFKTANYAGLAVYLTRTTVVNNTPVASISRSSNVVTVVTTSAHNFYFGDSVTISDITGFNGIYIIDVVNATTFTFIQVGPNTSGTVVPESLASATYGGITQHIQLLRNVDYIVSETAPQLTINYNLQEKDVITIKEYNQTYGSYCPSTPSTLGLYPLFKPAVILDDTYITPTYFIRGHDGSYNKLYGNYTNGLLDDFRDVVLLEFESRVYNNVKLDGHTIPLQLSEVIPGQFRNTAYTYSEILEIYSSNFFKWVGNNRVDYKKQIYNVSNKFTYNYSQSSNKLDNKQLNSGFWRGVYQWFYDTDHPATAPWEMLGLTIKPLWWDTHYGAAPYTSDNIYMWQDIANGFIWNNGDSYLDTSRIRPNLLDILPVDSLGNLLNPFIVIIGNYNTLTFNKDWKVGDQGPVETSYLRSSTWPFDAMKLLSLTRPAKFCNYFVDIDRYKFNSEQDQFLYDDRYSLDIKNIELYGNGKSKHSYLNWLVDYINAKGSDGYENIGFTLKNLDVRVTYRLAGFSGKNYLKFYIDHATPNGTNSSLLLPDENYTILLYDNVPTEKINYSSIIVQYTGSGYTVWGNNIDKQYFEIYQPRYSGNYNYITYQNQQIKVTADFNKSNVIKLPYGTLYYSIQQVCEFISSYGSYLTDKGVVFENIYNDQVSDWNKMCQEFVVWAKQNWEIGSTIAVNPNSKDLKINKDGLVVQPLTIKNSNYILNQNLVPIESQNSAVIRDEEMFHVKILSDGDTVGFTNLNLSSIEHGIVFDNETVFGDLIYNLKSGLRQKRMLLRGYKTNEWQGFLDTQGFILNEDNIQEWQSYKKYPKGKIVTYKGDYWVSNKLLNPTEIFDFSQWTRTDYEQIKLGILPNPSTSSYESSLYYDTNVANLEQDADLLSYSLIGFRPRAYLSNSDLSDITQINLFKEMIVHKGTSGLTNNLRNIEFDQGPLDYIIRENWAIKKGDFGAVTNSNFVEFVLNQNLLKGNPTLIGFTLSQPVPNVNQSVLISDIINYDVAPVGTAVLPSYVETIDTYGKNLPGAGYIDLRDANIAVYEFDDLNRDPALIENLRAGNIIWIAKHDTSWNIFTAQSISAYATAIENNQNNTLIVTFSAYHNLVEGDLIAITGISPDLNKFARVTEVVSLQKIIISSVSVVTQQIGIVGVVYKLVSRRCHQPSDAVYYTLPNSELKPRKFWADKDSDGTWVTYGAANVFHEKNLVYTAGSQIGTSVSYTSELGTIVSNPNVSTVYRIYNDITSSIVGSNNFGNKIQSINDKFYVSENAAIRLYYLTSKPVTGIQRLTNVVTVTSPAHGYTIGNTVTISGIEVSDIVELQIVSIFRSSNVVTVTTVTPHNLINGTQVTISDVITTSFNGTFSIAVLSSTAFLYSQVGTTENGELYSKSKASWTLVDFNGTYTITAAAANTFTYSQSGSNYTGIVTSSSVAQKITLEDSITGLTNLSNFTVSHDGKWIYAVKETSNEIEVWHYTTAGGFDYVTTINKPSGADSWGRSVSTSVDGAKLIVGAPNEDINAVQNVGAGYVYARRYEQFFADGVQTVYSVAGTINSSIADVYVNGVLITTGITVTTGSVTFSTAPTSSDIIKISYGDFILVQKLNSDNPYLNGFYGQAVDTNRYGADILVGAPFEITTVNSTPDVEGTVYKYTNSGQRYGVITALNPSVTLGDEIFINGWKVTFDATTTNAATIAARINSETPTNIIASGSNGVLVIDTLEKSDEIIFNIIDLFATQAVLNSLNIVPYTKTQNIYTPNLAKYAQFGSNIKFNEQDSVLISGPSADKLDTTRFDDYDACADDETIFDGGATTFIDGVSNFGMVYVYYYLPAYNEDINNPGKYAFGQFIKTDKVGASIEPNFGYSLDYQDNIIVVGTPSYYSNGNGLSSLYSTVVTNPLKCQVVNTRSLYVDKKPLNIVDINKLRNVSLYDIVNNKTQQYLDFIDPLQGKLLGVVEENIDFILNYDPANYVNGGSSWGLNEVGKVWLDTTNLRILNYHQPDIVYNADNWGRAFPGSVIDIYTWIESTTPPLTYTGGGLPIDFDRFVTYTDINNSTNSLVLKYYFWVKNYPTVPQGKSLSPIVMTSYLLDPASADIPFLSPITTNIIALTNSGPFIKDVSTVLHLGFGTVQNADTKHLDWELVADSNTSEFLSGFPSATNANPSGLYLKYIDSFSGIDSVGLPVPNPALPVLLRSGVSFRPRQTMFRNRQVALLNYIEYANEILSRSPISESRPDKNLLFASGINFDVTNYWSFVDWWAEGYDSSVKATIEVQSINELQTITTTSTITQNSVVTQLKDNLVVRVRFNNAGLYEYYIYKPATGWNRIGLENGTIKFDTSIAQIETRYIIRWINEVLYTNELLEQRNNSLILMLKYIQSEAIEQQNYMPWLNKTSLLDVNHTIRTLTPFKKFKRDNQDFLEEYINEVKPFHVYVKNFVFNYTGIEEYNSELTDFDLPAQYNADLVRFESPQLVYTETGIPNQYLPTDPIWQNDLYKHWFSKRGLRINFENDSIVYATYITENLDEFTGTVSVNNISGLPVTGFIVIDNEIIYYARLDVDNKQITNMFRGFDGTTPAAHLSGAYVVVYQNSVNIINSGRLYLTPPKLNVIYDTVTYPEPTENADIAPRMAGDRLIGGLVLAEGSGYAVNPYIQITGSAVEATFDGTNINIINNTITLSGHQFLSGDGVIFETSDESVDYGLVTNQYYYIRRINSNTVALYMSRESALKIGTDAEKTVADDLDRIVLNNTVTTAIAKLKVAARSVLNSTAAPVRMIKTYMNFNRVDFTETYWESGTQYNIYDVVIYNNTIYRCIVANTDVTFTSANWIILGAKDPYLTAANFVKVNYKPTANMTGNDIKQLMSGVDYPNSIFLSAGFDDPRTIDTVLISPSFTETSPTTYNVVGGEFADGYSPEELVSGVVSDTLNMTVTTAGTDLSFRLIQEKDSSSYVFNTNPYTQTTLAQEFNGVTDTEIVVTDYNAITRTYVITVTTDSNGIAEIVDINIESTVFIELSIPDQFTYSPTRSNRFELSVPTAPSSTFTVTLIVGNLIYLNMEYIGFTTLDPVTGTLSGLQRGLLGSPTNGSYVQETVVAQTLAIGTTVQGVIKGTMLYTSAYDNWWYGAPTSPAANTTLANNNSIYANFLKQN